MITENNFLNAFIHIQHIYATIYLTNKQYIDNNDSKVTHIDNNKQSFSYFKYFFSIQSGLCILGK